MSLSDSFAAGLAVVTLFAIASPLPAQSRFEVANTAGLSWYKGNTHTHTLESDGDSSPEYVAQWYQEHGYNFLVLSDHNVFTDPGRLTHLTDSAFILISGEELSTQYEGLPVHVNGLNLPGIVDPRTGSMMVATIQANVDAVREAEGVPHINHPNQAWSFGAVELAQIENDRLLEIYNGYTGANNEGGGGFPSLEEIWDMLLTGGKRIYGIAVDDAHHFQGEFSAARSNPGRGWIAVRARSLDTAEIMRQLEAGTVLFQHRCSLDGYRSGRRAHRDPDRIEWIPQVHHDFHWAGRQGPVGVVGEPCRVLASGESELCARDGQRFPRACGMGTAGVHGYSVEESLRRASEKGLLIGRAGALFEDLRSTALHPWLRITPKTPT